jgi:hypothetical protein
MDMQDSFGLKGRVTIRVVNPDGSVDQEQVLDNVTCDAGRAAIANHLTSGAPSPASLRVNKVALGTGTNIPAVTDIKLQTETYRNATASSVNDGKIAYFTGYFTPSECNGTYRELGLYAGGGAGADSGSLLSHVACNITKSAIQSLTVSWEITISNI